MNPGEIEIVDDPEQVAAAREAYARQHEERLMFVLQNPGEVRHTSKEDLGLLQASRARAVASLSALRDDNSKPPALRVEAIAVLDLLGITPDYQQFAVLGSKDDKAAKALLLIRSGSGRRDLPEPLKTFLVHCIQSHDSHVRWLAANQVGFRQVKEAFDALSSVIRAQLPQPELSLLEAAGSIRPSREILNLLRDQLLGDLPEWEKEDRLRAITSLGAAAQDIALREEVSLVCFEYLRSHSDTPSISGQVSGTVEFIAGVPPLETAKARLRELVLSSSWRLLQKDALDELEKLDATLAAEIRAQVGIERHQSTRRVTPPEFPKSTAEVAAVLVRTGVLTQEEVDRAIAKAREKSPGGAGRAEELPPVAFMAFADKLAFVNVKGDYYPARHDLLLEEFAKASGGLFKPEAALERYHSNLPDKTNEPDDSDGPGRWIPAGAGDYEVQFIHREKLYRFAPKDRARRIDVKAVLDAIHKALEDAGVSDRFVPHADSGEIGLFMFVNPSALKNASREIDLPVMKGFEGAF